MFAASDIQLGTKFIEPDAIRTGFTRAISDLYAREVPLYGRLLDLTDQINAEYTGRDEISESYLPNTYNLERHGAIRLGTPEELQTLRRAFAIMGMHPVGYYDLSVAGLPVHSTAFRPVDQSSLKACPFRIFCSVLRLDLVEAPSAREFISETLQKREIVNAQTLGLIKKYEGDGGLSAEDSETFISNFLQTFVWSGRSDVSAAQYNDLKAMHPLIADIVAFPGPHINHLTPTISDIDAAQAKMQQIGLPTKSVVEGPPKRQCPILLRQTAFKAVSEEVIFADGETGTHTARFGEIEQRGVALTPKGQALYDGLLAKTRANILPDGDGKNAAEYVAELHNQFKSFPDYWDTLDKEGLAYFKRGPQNEVEPIKYEDFLPVSAAGIFQSNLGQVEQADIAKEATQAEFETQLGAEIYDKFAIYADLASG